MLRHLPFALSICVLAPELKSHAAMVSECDSAPDPSTLPGTMIISFSLVCLAILLTFTALRALVLLFRSFPTLFQSLQSAPSRSRMSFCKCWFVFIFDHARDAIRTRAPTKGLAPQASAFGQALPPPPILTPLRRLLLVFLALRVLRRQFPLRVVVPMVLRRRQSLFRFLVCQPLRGRCH